jgi:hypothetical protein
MYDCPSHIAKRGHLCPDCRKLRDKEKKRRQHEKRKELGYARPSEIYIKQTEFSPREDVLEIARFPRPGLGSADYRHVDICPWPDPAEYKEAS